MTKVTMFINLLRKKRQKNAVVYEVAIKTIYSTIGNEFLYLHGLERKGSCAEAKEKETTKRTSGQQDPQP